MRVPHLLLNHTRQADQDTQNRLKALQNRNTDFYGEDIPLSKSLVPNWCIERIESWGKSAQMECFKDPQPAGDHDLVNIVFGGKVLVIDIVLKVFNAPSTSPRLELSSIKSTLATSQSASSPSMSPETVEMLLFDSLEKYIAECQKPPLVQDCGYARLLANVFQKHLKHLVELDRITVVKEEGEAFKVEGVSWLEEVGAIGGMCEQFALQELSSIQR
jgi:hypothetical protein